jgi:putative flippase GtrA
MSERPKLFNTINAPLPTGLVVLLNKHQRLITYAVIGGGAVLVDVGLFWIFNELAGLGFVLSNALSVFVAMVYSFILNALFNFRTRDNLLRRFGSFGVVTFCGYLVSTAILWLGDVLGLNATLVKAASLPFVLLLQFSLNSRFTFQATKNNEDQVLESIS